MNEKDENVSVVMISMNEELAIKKVVTDIQKECPKAEIVVVDSSSDKTAEIAKELGCVVVKQFPPKGYGPAMDTAFKTASRDIIVTLDCDDTYPIESIKEMLKLMDAGNDMVSGSRLRKRPKAMPYANYLANRFFCFLAWMICGVRSTDLHTGMRAYKKSVLQTFPYDYSAPALPVELQIGLIKLGYRCTEINIDYKMRVGETTLHRFSSTLWTLKRIWKWKR